MTAKKLLVTGGAGFIGTNFIRHTLRVQPEWRITNLDALTYAGSLSIHVTAMVRAFGIFVMVQADDPASMLYPL